MNAELTALHVMDPYLKQFYTEIYAQGRKEYLNHVESEIREQSRKSLEEIQEHALERCVTLTPLSRHGDPVEEFLEEAHQEDYDLAIVGAKPLTLKNRLRSRNLPNKIGKRIKIPFLIVRE
jgi:nucleotide-binding universal stress UspA family protein